MRAHERAPILTPAALLGAVVAVDVTRIATGIEPIGFLNLVLVWLLVQQLGFHLADGTLDRLDRGALQGIAGGALAVLATVFATGLYSPDMFVNLNPPTVALVLLGVAQLALFQLARPHIRNFVERADASRLISTVGERAMTVYLWHMPVLVGLAGLSLVANVALGMPLPEPLSFEWWATRPLWLGVAAAAVVPVVLLFARFERARGRETGKVRGGLASSSSASGMPAASVASTTVDALSGVAGVALLLVTGFGPLSALVALALLTVALVGSARLVTVARRAAVLVGSARLVTGARRAAVLRLAP
jgi:hypothetical protein